ncbi:hypothetical protein C2G38_2132846 [Gigaspora rosea]|uniref:Uncharacterized protein n=1 Tax=Gigaspora rosea TaxID=44941 RepID=A0A397UHL0_9GLOM|nr:hypothetical protein C2G38_2132846 [Gigaspora rosea]
MGSLTKKHLRWHTGNAPSRWILDKLTGTYAPRPSSRPHKLRECLPLEKISENFSLIYNTNSRFTIHKITADEATYKLAKVKPYLVTYDSCSIFGNIAMITGSRNMRRVRVVIHHKRHIIYDNYAVDRQFATLLTNDFIISEGNKPSISLPKGKCVKLIISKERDRSVLKK